MNKTAKIISVHAQRYGVLVCYEVDFSRESILVLEPHGIPQPGETWNLQYFHSKELTAKVADAPKEK